MLGIRKHLTYLKDCNLKYNNLENELWSNKMSDQQTIGKTPQ